MEIDADFEKRVKEFIELSAQDALTKLLLELHRPLARAVAEATNLKKDFDDSSTFDEVKARERAEAVFKQLTHAYWIMIAADRAKKVIGHPISGEQEINDDR